MKLMRLAAVVLSLCAMAGAGMAQDSAAKPGAILEQVPSGAMAFVVCKNLKTTVGHVDDFLAQIGMSEPVKQTFPDGLVEALRTGLKFGEGFNPEGGMGVALIDTGDLEALVNQVTEGKKVDVKVPFVLMIPGKDLKSLFAGRDIKTEAAGKFTKAQLNMGEVFTFERAGYVLISPNEKALTAFISGEEPVKNASKDLSKDQAALVDRSDVAAFINVKAAAPLLDKLLKMAEKKTAEGPGAPPPAMKDFVGQAFQLDRDMAKQLQGVALGMHFAKKGLIFEELVDYVPDSDMGKAIAAVKVPDKPLLGRVPNLNYAIAFGGMGASVRTQATDKYFDFIVKAITQGSEGKISDATAKKIADLFKASSDQMTGSQFVIGQAPKGSGVFGMACVCECKDSDKLKALMADSMATAQEVLDSLTKTEEGKPMTPAARELAGVKIAYTKNGGGAEVDSIDLTIPQMAKMTEKETKLFKDIVGDDKVRFLVKTVDKNTVLVTFGGSKAFLEEATKAATSGGPLPKDEGVVAVAEFMPKNLVGMAVFNAGNLLDDVVTGAQSIGQALPLPPMKLYGDVPVAMGVGVTGSTEHVVIYVPNALIKDASGAMQMLMQSRSNTMGGPTPGSSKPEF